VASDRDRATQWHAVDEDAHLRRNLGLFQLLYGARFDSARQLCDLTGAFEITRGRRGAQRRQFAIELASCSFKSTRSRVMAASCSRRASMSARNVDFRMKSASYRS
jgi:hypothetical protein